MPFVAFSEFISSNNFFQLLKTCWNLIDPTTNLGTYQQGLPIRPVIDFVWGTNSGLRTYPFLLFLTVLQRDFSFLWPLVYLVLTVVLPIIGFFFSYKIYKKPTVFTFIAAIFYGGNIWIIQRVFGGFWQLNIAYAFLPFLITIPLCIINEGTLSLRKTVFWSCLLSICTTIIFLGQPHFLIMLLPFYILLMFTLIINKEWTAAKYLVLVSIISSVIAFMLNLYSIVPSMLFPETIFTAPNQYFSLAAVTFNGMGANLFNVLRMSPTPFPFIEHTWNVIDYLQLIPIIVIFIVSFTHWKKTVLYFLPLCLLIFLSKGTHEPFGTISKWLYQNILLLHYFRDPTRFIGGAALYASFIFSSMGSKYINLKKTIYILFLFLSFMLLINIRIFSHKSLETFTLSYLPSAYFRLQRFFIENKVNIHDRYLSFPNSTNMKYTWYKNPYSIFSPNAFTMLVPLAISSADSNYYPDNYSSQASAFFYNDFTKTSNENILLPLSVKYFITDTSTENPLGTTLKNHFLQNEYEPVFTDNPLKVFKAKIQPQAITTQKPIFAIGNFQTIAYLHQFTPRPVVLLNQSLNSNNATVKILKGEDFFNDIQNPLVTLTGEKLLKSFSLKILKSGWDYNKIFSNYEPYKMDSIIHYGDLFTSGESVISQNNQGNMEIPENLSPGLYHILLKERSASDTFLILHAGKDSIKISIPITQKLSWIDRNTIMIDHQITSVNIEKTDPNQLILDGFVLVPEKRYAQTMTQVKSLLKTLHPVNINKLETLKNESTVAKATSDSILLSKPSRYITYRFSYGKYWTSDNPATVFISDGYGMTFLSQKPDIQAIYYPPNYYFHIFLILSIASAIGTIVFFIWYFSSRNL